MAFLRLAEHKNSSVDNRRAKQMRHEPTDGEAVLWYNLRLATKNKSYRFRRQHPIHPFVADFACLKLRLIVEVDGCSHDVRLDKDRKRDWRLAEMGWEVMRFSNEDVIQNREGVVTEIMLRADLLAEGIHAPLP